jgi:ribonuclease D
MSNRQATAFENDSTWIAGHEFPALTTVVLEQPFLALPSTLGNSERRTVYELCLHVGLYHTGTGQKFKDRYTVLSVHPDGFDHVDNLAKPLSFPVARCKPWFYRNDIGICPSPRKGMSTDSYTFSPHFLSRLKVRRESQKAKAVIEDLMAYPYQCLREDFESADSLSSIPKFEDEPGNCIIIDTPDKMRDCAADLSSDEITEIAFDVEAHNASKYKQATCLIQLRSNLEQEFVIDVLAPGVWDEVSLLGPLFANASIVKIGHGISGIDVPCLHRDFGIFIVNAFDTLEAANKLRLKKHLGLTKLCNYYSLPEDLERHATLKELYQNCDWRARPLTDDQVEYSIMDVRYLIQLRRLLIKDMLAFDRIPPIVTKTNGESASPSPILQDLSRDSTIGGVDSMDIESDKDIEGIGESAQSEDEDDDYKYEGKGGQNDDDNTNNFERSKSMEEDENSFFTAHDDNDGKSQSTIGSKVSELRYSQLVMDALITSQQRCLSLWTEKSEPSDKSDMLLQLMKRANRILNNGETRKKVWTKEDYWLYKELVEWRADAAKKIGIMPSFLCPLDLLVMVAYKRPGSLLSLRRLNYFLPDVFTENDPHLEDLFSVVAGAGAENELVNADAVVRLYSEREIRRKVEVPSSSKSFDAEIEENNGIMAPDGEDESKDKNIKDTHIPVSSRQVTGASIYKKLTAVTALATIAVFWMKVLKKK